MRRREDAFTILELTIALAIVMLVLFAAINFFIISVRQYKVETKITETNLEGILGLEILRRDLEGLGFGLPWNPAPLAAFTERTIGSAALLALNDTPNAPRAVVGIDCAAFTVNNSDYLVIKSARVGMDSAAGKWTTLVQDGTKRIWTPAAENLGNNDYVIVLTVGGTAANRRSLVQSAGTYYTQDNNTGGFVPTEPFSANIVYGIGGAPPFRPFNRADYYIDSASVPRKCAPGTGVLVKAIVSHDATGSTPDLLPLLDCVADLQVAYGLDNNADGIVDVWTPDLASLFPAGATAAADIRDRLVEVHVFILAQEGQRDDSFQYPSTSIQVGPDNTVGRSFDVSGSRNYRWKVYTMAVKPMSLAQ